MTYCVRKTIVDNIIDKKNPSYRIDKDFNSITLSAQDFNRSDREEIANAMVLRADQLFKSNVNGQSVWVDHYEDATRINIIPSKTLLEVYELKDGLRERDTISKNNPPVIVQAHIRDLLGVNNITNDTNNGTGNTSGSTEVYTGTDWESIEPYFGDDRGIFTFKNTSETPISDAGRRNSGSLEGEVSFETKSSFAEIIRRTSGKSFSEVLNSDDYGRREKQLYILGMVGKTYMESDFLQAVFKGVRGKQKASNNINLSFNIIDDPDKAVFFANGTQIYINLGNIIEFINNKEHPINNIPEYIRLALFEELIHSFVLNNIDEKYIERAIQELKKVPAPGISILEGVFDSTESLYKNNIRFQTLSDYNAFHEYVRQIVQHEILGKSSETEAYRNLQETSIIERIWNFLLEVFRGSKSISTSRIINYTTAYMRKYLDEGGVNPSSYSDILELPQYNRLLKSEVTKTIRNYIEQPQKEIGSVFWSRLEEIDDIDFSKVNEDDGNIGYDTFQDYFNASIDSMIKSREEEASLYIASRFTGQLYSNPLLRGLWAELSNISADPHIKVVRDPGTQSTIYYDPNDNTIALNLSSGTAVEELKGLKKTGKDITEVFNIILLEEIIHAYTVNSADSSDIGRIKEELNKIKFRGHPLLRVSNLYYTNGLKMESSESDSVIHEYLRQIIQNNLIDTTTEELGYRNKKDNLLLNKVKDFLMGAVLKNDLVHTQGLLNQVQDTIKESVYNMDLPVASGKWAEGVLGDIAKTLKDKMGISYEFITEEAAKKMTPNYNGESGFFYKGVVYLVKGKADETTVFHEFMHPFIDSLYADNIDVFNALVERAKSINPGLFEEVEQSYSDFTPVDRQKEFLVRIIISLVEKNNKSDKEKGFLQRVLGAIRSIVRKIFGKTLDLTGLTLNTTLEEFAEMFMYADKIILNKSVTRLDVVQFNRNIKDLKEDLSKISDPSLNSIISNLFSITKEQWSKLHSKKQGEMDIKNILTEGDRSNELLDALNKLSGAKTNFSPDNKLLNVALTFDALKRYIELLSSRINELTNDTSLSNKDRTDLFVVYLDNLTQIHKYLEHLTRNVLYNEPVGSVFQNLLDTMKGSIDKSINQMKKSNIETVVDVLYDKLLGVAHHAKSLLEEQERLYKEGKVSKTKYDRLKKAIEDKLFDRQSIKDYILGRKGDNKYIISSFIDGIVSNGDPIIAAFGRFVMDMRNDALADYQNFALDFNNEIAPFMTGYKSNPEELFKRIVFKDKKARVVWKKPENGGAPEEQYEEYETWSLLNPHKDYTRDVKRLEHLMQVANKEGNEDDYRKYKNELEALQAKWFYRKYTDEVYDLRKVWEDESGQVARKKWDDIWNQINVEEALLDNLMRTDPSSEEINDHLLNIKNLYTDLKLLEKDIDIQGNIKTDPVDLAVAAKIREYKDKSREIYEWVEKKGLFESRYMTQKTLLDSGEITKEQFDQWVFDNTREVLTDEYWKEEKRLMDIIATLSIKKDNKELNDLYKRRSQLISLYKDENNNTDPHQFTKEQIESIKAFDEEIESLQSSQEQSSGLSRIDQKNLNILLEIKDADRTPEQRKKIKEYFDKNKNKLSDEETILLKATFRKLAELRSKEPSSYYLDTVNEYASLLNINPFTLETVESLNNVEYVESLKEKSKEFAEWFDRNHIIIERFDITTKTYIPSYQRISLWNQKKPKDKSYYKTTKLSDGTVIRGIPTFEYYRKQVKDKYVTKKEIGVTVDAQGNYLPKMIQGSPYINTQYFNLSANDKKLLDIVTKYHFIAQQGATRYATLGYEIPRFLKGLDQTGLVKHIKGSTRSIQDKTRDFLNNIGNFKPTEFSYSDQSKIPIVGVSRLDNLEDVSLDLVTEIQRYMFSVQLNKKFAETDPIAKSLIDALENNNPHEFENMMGKGAQKGLWSLLKRGSMSEHKRLNTIKSAYEVYWEGNVLKSELPDQANKGIMLLMNLAAKTTLSLNIPTAFKNMFSANVQNILASLGGNHINSKEYQRGKYYALTNVIPDLIKDKNNFKNPTLNSQLYDLFDPVSGSQQQKIGKRAEGSYKRDFFNFKWLGAPMEYGEIESSTSFWMGMMIHQKVDQTINGVTKSISYKDAWEKDVDGKLKLKVGIDKEWGIERYTEDGVEKVKVGSKLVAFRAKMHELMKFNQGNYDPITQPLAQRHIYARLILFMRRYLVPGFMNRFGGSRLNINIGESNIQGFYVTTFHQMTEWIRGLLGKDYTKWEALTPKEKADIFRFIGEMSTTLVFTLLLSLLGYDDDDKDRFKKMERNNWVTNHMIYNLMMIKSESEQFIPIPGMGMDEIARLYNKPSVAFSLLDKHWRVVNDVKDWTQVGLGMRDREDMFYDKKTGVWEKGDSKLKAHLFKLVGYTGATEDPVTATKNYDIMQSRLK